jgi:hypothetical protein
MHAGGSDESQCMSGIVDLGVPILNAPDYAIAAQPRESSQYAAPGQVSMSGQCASAGEQVVQERARSDVGAFPDSSCQRIEKGHRFDQMRAEAFEHQGLFAKCFSNESEVELFEISDASMNELARTAGRSRRPVALFDERDGQPATRGIQGGSGADDATADDGNVEGLVLDSVQVGLARGRIEACRIHESSLFRRLDIKPAWLRDVTAAGNIASLYMVRPGPKVGLLDLELCLGREDVGANDLLDMVA